MKFRINVISSNTCCTNKWAHRSFLYLIQNLQLIQANDILKFDLERRVFLNESRRISTVLIFPLPHKYTRLSIYTCVCSMNFLDDWQRAVDPISRSAILSAEPNPHASEQICTLKRGNVHALVVEQRGQPLDRVIKDYQSSLVGGRSRSPDKYLVNPFTEKEKEKKKTRSTRRQSSKGTETEGKCRWFVNTAGRLTSSRNNRRRGHSGCN